MFSVGLRVTVSIAFPRISFAYMSIWPNAILGTGRDWAVGENMDGIRRKRQAGAPLDAFDRRILAALTEDATLSYAELGEKVNLSAPAVHERVKRLKQSGTIRDTVARLDGPAV